MLEISRPSPTRQGARRDFEWVLQCIDVSGRTDQDFSACNGSDAGHTAEIEVQALRLRPDVDDFEQNIAAFVLATGRRIKHFFGGKPIPGLQNQGVIEEAANRGALQFDFDAIPTLRFDAARDAFAESDLTPIARFLQSVLGVAPAAKIEPHQFARAPGTESKTLRAADFARLQLIVTSPQVASPIQASAPFWLPVWVTVPVSFAHWPV